MRRRSAIVASMRRSVSSRPRVLPAALALLVPLLVGGWTLTAVFAADSSPVPSPGASAISGDPTKGQQLYGQTCTACHGANLEGGIGPKLNPIQNLGDIKDPLDPTYLIATITDGKQGAGGFPTAMPPKGGNDSLTAADIQNITAFIIQANRTPSGMRALGPVELARSNVFWISLAMFVMVMLTLLLSRYNMRWIARRNEARREHERPG